MGSFLDDASFLIKYSPAIPLKAMLIKKIVNGKIYFFGIIVLLYQHAKVMVVFMLLLDP